MTSAIAEAQAQVATDWRSVSVFDAISSRQHSTQKMQSPARVPFVFLCFLVAGVMGQDVRPEFPEYFMPPTTQVPPTTISTEDPTTIANEETTIIATEEATTMPTETPTEEPATIATTPAEVSIISTTEPTTTSSTTEPTTTNPPTTTASEVPTTIANEETTIIPTTSTTEPSTTAPTTTTQSEPIYPTYLPPSTTSRRPFYPNNNPWSWDEPAERCYLKEQHEYVTNCWGFGWTSAFTCYRCCYYPNSNFAGCSRLHRGRCWWFD
ncbi:platelet glycoprotein Ib alpha chain [Drosophila kikkawai]|uniref:Platelet glycoprotein Ib alpha chain n=1 Tax=Drosophila kikkawai TaxID=30033 RepID=A0A6P4IW33_DROKI